METEANDMLIVIQSEKCFAYLKKIKEGAEKSSRHKRFKTLGLSQGGFGPFTLCEDLVSYDGVALSGASTDISVYSNFKPFLISEKPVAHCNGFTL